MAEIFDVFLSYNHADQEVVRELVMALRDRGVRIWRDGDNLPLGQSWQTEVQAMIPTAPAAAAVIGPSGIGGWHGREIDALLDENVRRKMPLIPVLLPGAPDPLPPFLSALIWSDLRAGLTQKALDELAWRIPKQPAEIDGPPGSGPRPHNLPFLSLGSFLKGRDKELQNLASIFEGSGRATAITQPQTIHGLGGIGKTRLAVEYAWRYGDRYWKGAFFIRSDSRTELRSGLAKLAGVSLLNLPVQQLTRTEDEIAEVVIRHLQEHSGWLLILDNVDTEEAAQAVGKTLPLLQSGHVLITSRLAEWPLGVEERSLDKLSSKEATQFLIERTEKRRYKQPDDSEKASDLAEILDGLPLALEQAAAYIAHRRISFSTYLKDWQQKRETVLNWVNPSLAQDLVSVAVTWQKTFDQLGPGARAILRLSAYLAPDPIPTEMFETGKDIMEEAVKLLCRETRENPLFQEIEDALGALTAYSMISHEGGTFRVHRMVQEVLRIRIPVSRRRYWIKKSIELVNQYSPVKLDDDLPAWKVWDFIRSHATELVHHGQFDTSVPTAEIISSLAGMLHGKGLYDQAEPLMRRALAIDEASFGPNHPRVARDLSKLAELLQDMDRPSEAEPLARRALAIDEASFGREHPSFALRLNNLAFMLKDANRLLEAKPLIQEAVEILERTLGPNHANTQVVRGNLENLL